MTRTARISTWLLVFATAAWLAACGSSEETLPPAPAPGASPAETPDAVPMPAEPERVGALPDNLPEDVPRYEDGEVAFSRVGADMTVSMRLWSDDDVAAVTAFYSDELAAKGWATETREVPGGAFLIGDKLGRKVILSVARSDDGKRTQVDMVVGE